MNIIIIAMTAVCGGLFALKMRQYQPEYSLYLVLATGVLLLYFCYDGLLQMVEFVNTISETLGGEGIYLKVLCKLIGIAYVSEFASDICKDAGYQTLAGQVQIAGKLTILVAAIPICNRLIQTVEALL